ncbi:uncharacterized protein F5147DRAFT_658072 [Suillus discolor]|uniref:Uncharacterized protein n=1 Tax=Suillus discolor TaxID=1912936 RepID=A0A9P7EVL2_9AGAM|nr:uncharacterized protein F5147DRAFT_658072 [Suillus discolor]KAG2090740.1 hypothetical protein F5147DRAFT_658072 [Suillus discolor]
MQHGSYHGCCVGSSLIVDFGRFEVWTLRTYNNRPLTAENHRPPTASKVPHTKSCWRRTLHLNLVVRLSRRHIPDRKENNLFGDEPEASSAGHIHQTIISFGRLASLFHVTPPHLRLMVIYCILTRIVFPWTNRRLDFIYSTTLYVLHARQSAGYESQSEFIIGTGFNGILQATCRPATNDFRPGLPLNDTAWHDSQPIPVVFRTLNGKLLGWYLNFIGGVPCAEILKDVSREVSEAFTANVHNNPSNWPSSSNPRMLEQRKGSGHRSLRSDIKENAHLF